MTILMASPSWTEACLRTSGECSSEREGDRTVGGSAPRAIAAMSGLGQHIIMVCIAQHRFMKHSHSCKPSYEVALILTVNST